MRNFIYTRTATFMLLASSGCFLAVAIAWCLGENTIVNLFTQLHEWQQQSRWWLEVPQFSNRAYLFLPTIILLLAVRLIIALSPQPRTWSRAIIIGITLAMTIRYLLWRSLSTLNLSNPVDGVFSLLLFLMELIVIISGSITLYLGINYRERTEEADSYAQAVIEGRYLPEVDILIPTYNEPEFILKRTIIGCQALDYPHKNIYVLDDTNRPEIKLLALALGCNYLTRPNNQYAKAGNLNHALKQTKGELVAVFDADFIPTTNFLPRTVGFFQNPQIGLVQTPQTFYNVDPIAHNLGLEEQVVPEEEVFYRYIEGVKDGAGSVVCAGTSFVVRRKALEEIGYFVTESISEDYFTGIRLSAQGYQIIYLPEKLSAGLAAESISTHIEQRLRWARGTLQAFFISANPLTIRGLSWRQRLGHLEGLIHWFTAIPSSFFLLVPIIYSFCGIIPLLISGSELVYFFLP
jgi:cellulose synthase (UDP-forming)